MDFEKREIGFLEADRRYVELKRQLNAGTISTEEFDAQRRRLMVQDDEGRWWAKSRKTGEWNYHDGNAWVPGTPPGYEPPRTPVAEDMPDLQSEIEQDERLPPSQMTVMRSAPVRILDRGKRLRGIPRWVAMAAAGLAGIAAIVIVAPMVGEGFNPASAYELVEDDSGTLSVEVPSDWDERIVVDSEGEKGRASWSSFLGDGESATPSITAVDDLSSWRNGTEGHQGVYMVASKELAQRYTDDELVVLGPNDYSSSCQAGTRQDFERPPYSGKMLEWSNCGGDSEHTAITLAAAPEGRECVVVAQIGGYFWTQTDEENIQHVLDTFEVDCGGI